METRGQLKSCLRDILSEKMVLTLMVDDVNVEEINELSASDVDIKIVKHKEIKKRSLDSNAYFHVLIGKIADKIKVSKPHVKNILLGKYGQREFADEKPLVVSIQSDISVDEREDIHLIPCGYDMVNGIEYTEYFVIRGSHTYNSEEMSVLINGTVEDAKELGIETMTPDEILRMNAAWISR